MLDEREVGPIEFPEEIGPRCQVSWSISGVIGSTGKRWRIVEAWKVLAAHPNLGAEAEAIARSHLGEVSFETIADEVQEAVRAPDLDDLNGRAGRHAWGYVEPTEAAWEILGESVEPFVADMKRRMELGLEADALEICKGVVLGLYRVERGEGGELAAWAPDFPAEAAGDALETWRRGNGPAKAAAARPR